MQRLDIQALHFLQCGVPVVDPESKAHAIVVQITGYFHLEMCVLESCPSAVLHMGNAYEASLLNNTFVGNNTISQAAAINVYDSTVISINNTFCIMRRLRAY